MTSTLTIHLQRALADVQAAQEARGLPTALQVLLWDAESHLNAALKHCHETSAAR